MIPTSPFRIGALVACLTLVSVSAFADPPYVFDFENGLGGEFETTNTGNLWTVDTDGPSLRTSKPEDPLIVEPHGFIYGGIKSVFYLDGDFTITVDFELFTFQSDPSNPITLNESLLGVEDLEQVFEVLRYTSAWPSQHLIEAFGPHAPHGWQPAPPEVLWTGRYRIKRIGDVMTGSFAPLGSDNFTTLGSAAGYPDPVRVFCVGVQGPGNINGDRAKNPMDIAFDNLIVDGTIRYPSAQAQGTIVGWGSNGARQLNVPEPNENFVAVAPWAYENSAGPDDYSFSLGLKSDATVVGWGADAPPWIPPYDDIIAITPWILLRENGSLITSNPPPGPNAGFVAIGDGGEHSLAIREGGEIVAWGANFSGQCNVPEPNTGYLAATGACTDHFTGAGYTLAINANGSIVGWGANVNGVLDVPEPNAGFVKVAAARTHALGLKQDGSIVRWGSPAASPPPPPGPFTAIAAATKLSGQAWSAALRDDGTITEQLDTSAWSTIAENNWTAIALSARNRYALRGRPVLAIAPSPPRNDQFVFAPNPFTGVTRAIGHPAGRLEVYDVGGRLLRVLAAPIWDGTDEAGRPVARGVYLLRLDGTEARVVKY